MKGIQAPFGPLVLITTLVALAGADPTGRCFAQGSETIYPDTVTAASRYSDAPNWELGTIFRPTAPGKITGLRVFSLADESGQHFARIFRNTDNSLLAGPFGWEYGGEEGWITMEIGPVPVEAGIEYTVSVSVGADGWYPANANYFAEAANNGAHLAYPQGAGVFSATAGNRPTEAFNNTTYLRDIVFTPDLSGAIFKLTGKGVEIADGDSSPTAADDTHFGGAAPATGSVEHTFTISNTGGASLELTGNPKVSLAGPQASDFTVTTQPGSPIAAGASTTFTIRFQPSAAGIRDASVIVTNSTSPGAPFQFAIEGVGLGTGNLTLGSRSEGTLLGTIADNSITGNRFLALRNMQISALQVKVRGFEGLLKGAVYSDSNGSADKLLRATAEITNPTNGWQRLPLTQPLDITAGAAYWLTIWTDIGQTRVYAENGGPAMRGDYPYGDWPDPVSLAIAAGNLTFSIYAEGLPADVSGPEIYVKGSGAPITEDSTATVSGNGTDFGAASVQGGTRETTFTIENVGKTDLTLTGNPKVAINGAGSAGFTVTAEPGATVAPGATTTFTIKFDPAAVGPASGTVSIAHNGSASKPFTFAISGIGLGGGAGVLGSMSEGTAARNIDDSQIHGNRFQAPVDMRISELHAKVLELAGTFKCAVYSDANGFADRLLRGSVDVLNATNGWNTFALTSPLEVKGGDYYWLAIWSDTVGARVQFDPVGTSFWATYNYAELAGQWPDPIDLIESSQFLDPPARTYCIYGEGVPLSAAPGPEIDLRGLNGKLMVTPDITPSLLDGSDFGSLDTGSGTADRTFTIENSGNAALELQLPVGISGANAADFAVTTPPPASIPAGGKATFTVRFDPSVRGLRAGSITITNNDVNENPLEFAVQGAGFTSGRESIWPDTKTGKGWVENTPYELGMIFQSSVAGKITHLRVYAADGEAGDHIGRIWQNADETVVGGPYTWNFSGVTGWITFDIPDVDIDADTDYTVALSTGNQVRNYANVAGDLSKGGDNGQHLSWPDSAGVFSTTLGARPTESYNGGNYLRDVIFVPAGATVDLPDMDVRGNNTSIADGDQTPSAADGTDFGQVAAGGGSVERTFTIGNAGAAPLNLTGSPKIAISGPQAGDFTVVTEPGGSVVPGASSGFTLRFAPSAEGARNAILSIANDSDENPYDFAITGTGTAPSSQVKILQVTVERATASITLTWEGAGPQFQVEKAAAVTGPYQAVGSPVTTRTFTDSGALNTGTQTFYRIRQL